MQVTIAQLTSYFLNMRYELVFIARVTNYFLYTSYGLLLIAQNTRILASYEMDKRNLIL